MLSPGEIGGIAGAGFVALAGSGVSVAIVTHRRRRVRNALHDSDPGARLAALDIISERGVYRFLDALTERALVEADPEVQESLARIVSHAHSDPSSDGRLLQLKGWAERVTAPSEKAQEVDDSQRTPGPAANDVAPATALKAGESRSEQQGEAPTAEVRPGDQLSESDSERHDSVEAWLVPDPWAAKPVDSAPNGSRPESQLESVGAREPIGAAKAERSAIELLKEAGYGVERPQHAKPAAPTVPAEAEKPDLRQTLQDFLAQRVITVTILEEAVRRMRAENERLESSFGSELGETGRSGTGD